MLSRHFQQLDHHETHLFGDPGMIDASVKVFKSEGMPKELIFYDKFAREPEGDAYEAVASLYVDPGQDSPGAIIRDGFLGQDRSNLVDILTAYDG